MTNFFKYVLTLRWSQFVDLELSGDNTTSAQAVILSLVRACARGRLPAIREALDRIDGKVAAEMEVEYPKFYFLFPYAKSVYKDSKTLKGIKNQKATESNDGLTRLPDTDKSIAQSLRAVMNRMAEKEQSFIDLILTAADEIDIAKSYKGQMPGSDPLVSSVIVAGLFKLAKRGNLGAIFEVLDQIDGKVSDKIKMLGGDVYMERFDVIAPAGAVKNKDGIYQLVADNTTNSWAASLERSQNNGRFER